jgi:hypothetical protein
MWELLQKRKFIDVVIHIDGRDYECHRLVLASVGGYFYDLLMMDFSESNRDEIELHIPDPTGFFSELLKYVYTKDLAFVGEHNALAVWSLALYFRLPDLKAHAESFFGKLNDATVARVLDQVKQSPGPFLPRAVADFIARSFYQLLANAAFLDTPQSIILQLIENQNLRVASERQLANTLIAMHAKSPFSESMIKRCSHAVLWPYLALSEWDGLDWPLFISQQKKDQIIAVRAALGTDVPRIQTVLVALNTTDPKASTLRLAGRYVPNFITFFRKPDRFFDNPSKFHVDDKLLRATKSFIISMLGSTAIVFHSIEIILSNIKGAEHLAVVGEPLLGKKNVEQIIKPTNVEGTGVYQIKLDPRTPWKKVTLRFILPTGRFAIASLAAEGFVFLW